MEDKTIDKMEERRLEAELKAAGYRLDTDSQKAPSTRPNNDYDWLGYWLICEGPRGRHRAHYALSSLEQVRECHRWALGELPFVPTPRAPSEAPVEVETIEVTKASFDAYQRAAEGYEQQAHRANLLLHDIWRAHLRGDVEFDSGFDQECLEGLDQYRQQYGDDWPLTEEDLDDDAG